jgi:hypothetical protein
MPEGKFSVSLSEGGLCNYCAHYEKHAARMMDFENLRPLLEHRLEAVRGKYEYDALVGISGGKDSTYVLYRLVKEYGARVLAFTYENGFLTDLGKKNIKNAVEKLGVDHFFHYPDWNVHKILYRACFRELGDPCLACAFAGFFLTLKICSERRIPFFIAGRSPSQIFRNFFEGSRDLFIPMMNLNLQEHSFEKVAAVYRKLNDGIQAWIGQLVKEPADIAALSREFLIDSSAFTAEFAPEIVSFFLYEPYHEEAMKRELERELGYQRKENDALLSHLDCRILEAAEHLYSEIHGLSMVAQEVAVMLRRSEITPEAAREILRRRPAEGELNESIRALCGRLDMGVEEFARVTEELKRQPPSKFDSR